MPRYLLHGLCVETDAPLNAVPADGASEPDVRLAPWQVEPTRFDALVQLLEAAPRLIDRNFPVPDGAPALRSITIDHEGCWLSLIFNRVMFRFDRRSQQLQRLVRTADDLAFAEVLQAGSYWAILSALRGRVTHHASAIDLAALGGTVLVAARSGQGKSSTAAALVLAGGYLRSDDVVTLVRGTSSYQCESGSLTLRMRKPIAEALPNSLRAGAEDSGDQRHLYYGNTAIPTLSPVVAVLFPQLEDTASDMSLETLHPLDGFRALAQEPRVSGVQDRAYQAARVAELTALCGRVPLRSVRMSLAQRDLAQQGAALLELLRADPAVTPP